MNVPVYTASPAFERSTISKVVNGHATPIHDWTTTILIAAICTKRNHGLRTQDHLRA